MPWIIAGGAIAGGLLSGNAAKDAAQTSANAQLQSSQMAADAAKFRPVGITNTFGTSNFQFSPEGYLTSAGYTLDPRLQAIQGGLMGGLTSTQQDVANIQSMGRQYMAQSPQEAAQSWMANQQALLNPARQQAQANLNNNLFNQGTGGLSTAQAGGGMANPQQQALANAQALQDLQLASQAQQQGQQQYTFGQGLLTGAYSPLQSQLGTSQLVEQLGQTPFDLGTALGAKQATSGASVGSALLQGGLSAAKTAQAGNAYSPFGSAISGLSTNQAFTSGLGNWMGNYNNNQTMQNNNAAMFNNPNYLDQAGQLPTLDYSSFQA
jgi:hypothetical protein